MGAHAYQWAGVSNCAPEKLEVASCQFAIPEIEQVLAQHLQRAAAERGQLVQKEDAPVGQRPPPTSPAWRRAEKHI
jgi:hypothetical protein